MNSKLKQSFLGSKFESALPLLAAKCYDSKDQLTVSFKMGMTFLLTV